MGYTIEQFLELRDRVERLRASTTSDRLDSRDATALEEEIRNTQRMLTTIAISPEGEEESTDCFTWGLEALMDDDTERAIGFLDISLALDLEHFRHDRATASSVRHTGTLLGKIYVREQRVKDAAYCFEAVLETMSDEDDEPISSDAAEAAVRLASLESGRGNSQAAIELMRLAYDRGRKSESDECRGYAGWAATFIAEEEIEKQHPEAARALLEDALRLASNAKGREGLVAGAQAALKILSGMVGEVSAVEARRVADQGVTLSETAAGSGHPYARQTHCFALLSRANLLIDIEEWEDAESDLRAAVDQSDGIKQEGQVRELVSALISRFPAGWFDGDPDDENNDE